MTDSGDGDPNLARTSAEAADWVVRLAHGASREADWLSFVDWLDGAGGPARREAFDTAHALWLKIDAHGDPMRADALKRRRSHAYRAGSRASGQSRQTPARLAVAAALAVSICAALFTARTALRRAPASTPALAFQTYATGVGDRRKLRLADGTTIWLNSVSRIEVSYTAHKRRVVMEEAEADFDVVHDPRRPFVVDVGDARASVLGTAFDIGHYDGETRISVSRGQVHFQTGQRAVALGAGMAAVHRDGAQAIESDRVDPSAANAWKRGRLVYRGRALSEVVADLNRHYATPVRVTDPAVAKLRFTGVLALGSQPQTLSTMALLLPVRVHRIGKAYVLDPRSP